MKISKPSFYSHTLTLFFFIIMIMMSHVANSQSHQLYDEEHAVLMKIKQYLQNPPFLSHWTQQSSTSNNNHCSWPEINCTTNGNSVISLTLSNSNITKAIPTFICELKNLTFLDFSFNFIPGEFPTSLYNCSKLQYLDLSMNNFVGNIPDDMHSYLSELRYLNLGSTNFTGDIPSSIGRLKELRELKLHYCYILYLFQNNLSGEIPKVVEALNLVDLDLAQNNLTGKIPEVLGKLMNITWLNLSLNKLSGEIPEAFGSLPAMVDFRMFSNNLSGTLPSEFGRYSRLETFLVSSNSLSGNLPENLCYNGRLLNLTVYDNNLSGELPKSLGNCNSLLDLKIYNNKFSGNIPSGLWTSLNLSNFMVSHNNFTGELPEMLSSSISRLEISYNQLSGRIPATVSSWTNVVVFDASKNNLNGSIPQELTSLPKLTTLLLDQNQLTGPLPSDIIHWENLVTLNLRQNKLSGQIPDALGRLPVLSQLDLSENQFTGQVPSQLPRLTNLNLSSNHLTGRVPNEFENSAFDTSFLDNPGLCSDTPELNLALCNSTPQRSGKGSSWSVSLITSLVVAAFLMALLATLLIMRLYRKRKQEFDNSWKLISFQRLNFTESDILSSLTEQNIIGSGGYGAIYRCPVDDFGYVAVKKIWNDRKLDQKLKSSFRAEVNALSNIRHTNIVRLLCCISNEESMLLVYEYMENSSLDKWLHKKYNKASNFSSSAVHHVFLDWPKRLQIAIGVAQGLSYMHHDCSQPIVHRDVKTSNILLDAQFNAKVADFGLARMLLKPGQLNTMSTVIGSFGYIAPEYTQTRRITEKIDVFSFGVVLLELTTGKEANDGDQHLSLAEWAWRHIQIGSNIEELLDKDVMEPSYLDEMCTVFKLGVMCTSTLASTRPSMKEVLQMLQLCRDQFDYGGDSKLGHYDVVPLLKDSKSETRLDVVDTL
ncbi:receptor-like protein kinase 5 [Arachis ipaensis]|uniref:receptor-like protein kinase 5 n=1 Tax=Arachis ipaensis TaxID=130454 RepID=UPI0007AF728F|nr:receptor-like protein kinase 5 [Arachis ipaensis]